MKRFDLVYWIVNFLCLMMVGVIMIGLYGLWVDFFFYCKDDLVGLIWVAEDSIDYLLLVYEMSCDFWWCVLWFWW